MKKNSLKYVCTFFLCAVLSSPMVFATQYCRTPIISNDGTATIYLSCQSIEANQYEIKIESNVAMSGLGGSFANVNGVGYQLNVQGRFQLSTDKLTITIPITSTTPPSVYTPLYVLMPGEKVFTWPNDVEWGVCETPVPDDVAPVMGTATVVGDPSYYSAVLALTATDNITNPVTRFVANDPDNNITDRSLTADENGNAAINGLSPSTTYNLTIHARDDAGNTSENSASVSFTTATRESDCVGDKGHFATPTVTKIHYTIQYLEEDVIYTITPINAEQTIGFAETQTTSGNYPMTIATDGKSATYTQTGLAYGNTVGIRFLYNLSGMPGNEMTSENITLADPNIIYYVVGECENSQNPTDDVAPVMVGATVVGTPSYDSVVLTLTATDNVTDPVTRFVANDTENNILNRQLTADAEGNVTLSNLSPSTSYNLTINAKDDAGNTSENSASVSFTTAARESDCVGDKGHFATPTVTKIHYTIQYSEGNVTYTFTPIDPARTIDFAEVQTTSGSYQMEKATDGKSAAYTHTGLTLGSTIGIRFLYSLDDFGGNEMTSENITLADPNIIYYVVGECNVGVTSMIWNGSTDSDWGNPANWTPSSQLPDATVDVTIPGGLDLYPVLKETDNAVCKTITFEMGGEIGQPQYLNYLKAFAGFNIGTDGKSIEKNRYYTISAPLKNMVAGDFSFGGKPLSYAQYADVIENITTGPESSFSFTDPLPNYNVELSAGFGFAYFVDGPEGGNPWNAQDHLNNIDGKLVFPYFTNQTGNDINATANPHHEFDEVANKSTFYYFYRDTNERSGNSDQITRGKTTVNSAEVYLGNRFNAEEQNNTIPATINKTLKAGETLVGNPFMSHLDFGKLYVDNSTTISPYFRIWNNNSAYTVTVDADGKFDATTNTNSESDDLLIAPWQAFFVDAATAGTLEIKIANVSTTKTNSAGDPALRSDNIENERESLKIIAHAANGASAVVIHRDRDVQKNAVRKIFTPFQEVPEIYIIDEEATEIMETNKSITSIPLGIRALNEENITLTFNGLNTLNEKVKLYDRQEDYTVEINEQENTHSFIHNANVPERFFVLFNENGLTDVRDLSTNSVSVYCRNNTVKIRSSSSNPIQTVKVYNMQGQMISVKDKLSVTTLDLNIYTKGIYLMDIITKDTHIINKIVNY